MNEEQIIKSIEAAIDTPISRALSLVIRPTFAALKGHTYVWGDWSAIEARVLPWLADSRRANEVLKVFEGNDNDPKKPDIYVIEVANLKQVDPQNLWDEYLNKNPEAKDARGEGKVSVLSLGFGGSIGALTAMATNYGVFYDEADAKHVVNTWRENNPWARTLWDKLWDSFLGAMEEPETIFKAGRVAYMYAPGYMGGTVFCALPCGRVITYPSVKWHTVEQENPYTGELEHKRQLSYKRGFGRAGIWYGKLAENITQATAASLLRRKMVELAPDKNIVGHTHDELIGMPKEEDAAAFGVTLRTCMEDNPDWMQGCPLAAEISNNWYYTKAVD